MAFYYVKSGGTATGDGGRYASEKANNSWATEFSATSEYYVSIEAALSVATTKYVDGDVIYISSASSFSDGTSISLTLASVPNNPVVVYSVDDSAVQEYLAGAFEEASGSNADYSVTGNTMQVNLHGVTIKSTDDIVAVNAKTALRLLDGGIRLDASGDKILASTDAAVISLTNTSITADAGTTAALVEIAGGSLFEMFGGSTVATSGSLNDFIGGGGGNGGLNANVIGADLSNHGSGTFLLGNIGSSLLSDDLINVSIEGCKLSASVGFVEESFVSSNHKFKAVNCSSSSTAAEYQFYQRTWAGDVEDQDSAGIHRDESTAFSGGEKVSMKVTTVSDCSKGRPLIVDLPARFAALSSASTDTIRIYFAQVNTQPDLTDANCWAELYYPDGTTKNLWNSASNRVTNILAAGTQHTDDSASSTWLNGVSALAGYDEYRMDIDTSGDVGADSVPIIRIFIAEPSAIVYIDTTVDVVA